MAYNWMTRNSQAPEQCYAKVQVYITAGMSIRTGDYLNICAAAIFSHIFFLRVSISLENIHLFAIHVLGNIVCLPLLKAEPHAFVAVVFVICLVFVIFDLDEIRINRSGIEG